MLELDCDRRATALMKKHKLPIDVTNYIQESNSYILSYNYIHEHRNFFKESAYSADDVKRLVPKRHLRDDQLDMIIPKHRDLFLASSVLTDIPSSKG